MTDPERPPSNPPPPTFGEPPVRVWHLDVVRDRIGGRAALGVYVLLNGLLTIALLTAAAMATGVPLIFPSLGPTAYLLFSDPLAPAAAPRNTVLGHAIGTAAGWVSLATFDLLDAPAASAMAITPGRVGAAAASLALTGGAMVWLGLPHPPAAATTLIVSLGILHQAIELVVLLLAVVVLVLLGFGVNRLAGIRVPAWAPQPPPAASAL